MKNYVKLGASLGLVVVLTSASALAWSGAVQITSIDVDSVSSGNGTSTYITPATTPSGKPSCGTGTQVTLSGTADHVKAMTALAMSAFLAGKSVKFSFNGSCTGTYSQVDSLLIQ